jgi:hypothetical protein
MNNAIRSYKIASWSLVLVSIGHTITYLTAPVTEGQKELILKMKEFSTIMLGSEISVFSFHEGFSLMMGLLLFGFGGINLFLIKVYKETSSSITLFNILISTLSLLLSIKYFFIVPIVFTGVAALGFSISAIIKKA